MIEPLVITPPVTLPVSLADVRTQLRITAPSDATELATENAELTRFIQAARNYYEWRTARTIHETELEYVLDNWPSGDKIRLPRATPLISPITSVKYKNSAGTETEWSSAEYIADTDSTPGRLVLGYGQSWPSFTAYPVNPIRIRYKAGIATTSPITEAGSEVKIPLLLLVAGMYENRESETVTDRAAIEAISMRYGVEAFIQRRKASYEF